MSASQSGLFSLQEFTDAGAPLVGGRLYTLAFGTTTHKTAYTDKAGTIAHSYTSDGAGGQYIALNARGELPAPLYLTTGSYDLALKRADGSTVWTRRADPLDADLIPISRGGTGATDAAGARTALALVPGTNVATMGANTFTGAQTLPGNAANPLEAVPLQQLSDRRRFGSSGVKTPTTATDLVTGIPTWAKRVTVVLNGLSMSGTPGAILVLGTSSGLETTGYTGLSTQVSSGGAVAPLSSSSSFVLNNSGSANSCYGQITFSLNGTNTWVCSGHVGLAFGLSGASFIMCSGAKTLSGALERIQLSSTNGTDLFDAGGYEVIWEG